MKKELKEFHGNKKITTEIFIKKAQDIHNNKYSHLKASYKKYHDKLIITCPNHGDFIQSPYLHLRGSGCPLCYGNNRITTEKFIQKAQNIHGNKYSYELSCYINNRIKLIITCPKHGNFQQRPTRHLSGDGCPKCGIISTTNKNKLTTEEFIRRAEKIHGKHYDYSKSNYIGWDIPLTIICSRHSEFEQKPIIHLNYCGCPDCGNNSKGELRIKEFLESKDISFIREMKFDDCISIHKLRFDFYIPTLNTVIEFDGIQHFKPINVFGGVKEFQSIKNRDEIKNSYCKTNSINLIRIKYNENIENKLNKCIMKQT